jgi:WD40 repeat protein
MTLSDVRLIDPSAKMVHAAILDAFCQVSDHGIAVRISHTKISQKRVAHRAANEAEGVELWASRGTVAFSPDGVQVAIGYDRAIAVHHAATGERRFWDGQLPDEVAGVAFDASGKWLFAGRHDGTLVAYRTDIISNERSVVFRWSLGPIRALAACGDTLLAACDEGVQLWPMAKLLEGV